LVPLLYCTALCHPCIERLLGLDWAASVEKFFYSSLSKRSTGSILGYHLIPFFAFYRLFAGSATKRSR
jgi:hypothetical protein